MKYIVSFALVMLAGACGEVASDPHSGAKIPSGAGKEQPSDRGDSSSSSGASSVAPLEHDASVADASAAVCGATSLVSAEFVDATRQAEFLFEGSDFTPWESCGSEPPRWCPASAGKLSFVTDPAGMAAVCGNVGPHGQGFEPSSDPALRYAVRSQTKPSGVVILAWSANDGSTVEYRVRTWSSDQPGARPVAIEIYADDESFTLRHIVPTTF